MREDTLHITFTLHGCIGIVFVLYCIGIGIGIGIVLVLVLVLIMSHLPCITCHRHRQPMSSHIRLEESVPYQCSECLPSSNTRSAAIDATMTDK